MSKTIFYSATAERKREFATETLITKEGERLAVVKKPYFSEASPHIAELIRARESLSSIKELQNKITLVPVSLQKDGSAVSPYIRGRSVEAVLVEALLRGDQQMVVNIFSRLMGIIDTLPAHMSNPSDNPQYVKIFGDGYQKTACVSPGVIDLNFDNFIVDGNDNWHLFDYEWVFDFPVPKEFIVQRIFVYFFALRFRELVLLAGGKNSLIILADDFFIPAFLYDKYKDCFKNFRRLMNAEFSFQQYAHPAPSRGKDFNWEKEWFTAPVVASQEAIDEALRPLRLIEEYERITVALRNTQTQNDSLRGELSAIKNSKSYQYALKASRAKNKFRHLK